MTDTPREDNSPPPDYLQEPSLPPIQPGYRLLRRVLLYHIVLAVAVVSLALIWPDFISELPVGGVTELAEGGDPLAEDVQNAPPTGDI